MINLAVYSNDSGKCRVAMCTVYPDSAPADWLYRLRNWHVPAAVSPLHDKDTWDSDKYESYIDDSTGELKEGALVHKMGEYKKPHYHVMVAWGNSTTFSVYYRIFADIGGVVPPWDHLEVMNVNSMYRYFAHLDDPDKYQYDPDDIVLLGGFDPVNYQTYIEKNAPFLKVLDVINNSPHLHTYTELLMHLKNVDPKLFYFACNHTLTLKEVMKDRKDDNKIGFKQL